MDYTLLVMLLKNLVILPFQEIKLELKDEISKNIIKISSKKYNNRVLIVSPINSLENDLSIEDLPNVGVVAYIKSKIELANGNFRNNITLPSEENRFNSWLESDYCKANVCETKNGIGPAYK